MKLENGNLKFGAILLASLFALPALSATREISETWDVGYGPEKKQSLTFFQTESVDFELTSMFNGSAFELATNDVVVWEITGWDDYTNVYACVTGTVTSASSGVSIYSLTPEQSNFDEGSYRGFAKALQLDGTNVSTRAILAYQHIKVKWSPNSSSYNLVEPLDAPTAYSYTNETWSISSAPARIFNETWAVEAGQEKHQALSFFQTEAVQLNETFTLNGSALDCSDTNTTYVWEINGWDDYTNTYALVTGSVTSGTNGQVRFELPPWKSNITNGTYQGFIRALENDGVNVTQAAVLAYQTINVAWAPDSRHYSLCGPLSYPMTYSADLVDAMGLSLSNSVAALVTTQAIHTSSISTISNDLDAVEVDIETIETELDDKVSMVESGAVTLGSLMVSTTVGLGTGKKRNIGMVGGDYAAGGKCNVFIGLDSGLNSLGNYKYCIGNGAGINFSGSDYIFLDHQDGSEPATNAAFMFDADAVETYVGKPNGDLYFRGTIHSSTATKVDELESGTEAFEGLRLDGVIDEWSDIGLTYTNAVRLNSPISVTNDSLWTGWTTDGDLVGTNIFLETGEYLLSPLQPNGIANYTFFAGSTGNGTAFAYEVVTNGVASAYPYYGADGRIKITAGDALPGMTPGVTVSNAVVVGYDDRSEAEDEKTISSLRVFEAIIDPDQVPDKAYVDDRDEEVEAYADAAITAYGADSSKPLLGDYLQLGEYTMVGVGLFRGLNWTVDSTDSYIGTRFGDQLITLTSGLCAVEITSISHSGTNATVELYAQNISGLPTVEIIDDLIGGTWTNSSASIVDDGGGDYTATVDVTGYTEGFFRVYATADPVAASSVKINAGTFDLTSSDVILGDIVTTNTFQLVVSNGTLTVIQL